MSINELGNLCTATILLQVNLSVSLNPTTKIKKIIEVVREVKRLLR